MVRKRGDDFNYIPGALIDSNEEMFPLADLAKKIPGRPAPGTVKQWAKRGIFNTNTNQFVKLETIKLPRGRGSSMEAYHRFLKGLNKTGT